MLLRLYLIFCSSLIFAQTELSGRVDYNWITTKPFPSEQISSLNFNEKESLFEWSIIKSGNETEKDGTINYYSNSKSNLKNWVFKNLKDDFIFLNIHNNNKAYLVKNDEIDLEWNLIDEFKVIGTYRSQKAITKYKGRNIIAWFSEEIPVNFGPHIWNGLPGLILELYDDKMINYYAAKTILIESKNLNFNNIKLDNFISIKEYEEILNENINDLEKKINSRRAKDKEPVRIKNECEDCN